MSMIEFCAELNVSYWNKTKIYSPIKLRQVQRSLLD